MRSQRRPWPDAIELLFGGGENIDLSQNGNPLWNGLKTLVELLCLGQKHNYKKMFDRKCLNYWTKTLYYVAYWIEAST